MKQTIPIWLLALLLSGLSVAAAQEQAETTTFKAEHALRSLYDTEWDWRQREFAREKINGRWQTTGRFPSVAPADWERRAAYWQQTLIQLDAIDTAALGREEAINAAVFRTAIEADYNNAIWRTWEMPFNSDTFFWGHLNPRQPYQNEQDWRYFIQRLQDIPRYFDQQIANMRNGLQRGWSIPRVTLNGRDNTIVPYTLSGEDNPFLATLEGIPTSIPEPVRDELREAGRKAVIEYATPAYARLLAFIRDEYLPNARTTIAASDLPDGDEFYASQIREYVTREMSAQEIHSIGLAEVERISEEMQQVMRRAEFAGSFAEFLLFLRNDPQFYAKTPQELLSFTAWIAKKVDGQLKYTIGILPRYRFTIMPVCMWAALWVMK